MTYIIVILLIIIACAVAPVAMEVIGTFIGFGIAVIVVGIIAIGAYNLVLKGPIDAWSDKYDAETRAKVAVVDERWVPVEQVKLDQDGKPVGPWVKYQQQNEAK